MRVNEPDVVFQVFADEIVVVNLVVGKYYSLDGMAAFILSTVVAGLGPEEIVSSISSRFGEPADVVSPDVLSFLDSLTKEGIIVDSPQPVVTNAPPSFAPAEYRKPVLNTYDEMQDLLLMDPVHDVDELGWPNKKT